MRNYSSDTCRISSSAVTCFLSHRRLERKFSGGDPWCYQHVSSQYSHSIGSIIYRPILSKTKKGHRLPTRILRSRPRGIKNASKGISMAFQSVSLSTTSTVGCRDIIIAPSPLPDLAMSGDPDELFMTGRRQKTTEDSAKKLSKQHRDSWYMGLDGRCNTRNRSQKQRRRIKYERPRGRSGGNMIAARS